MLSTKDIMFRLLINQDHTKFNKMNLLKINVEKPNHSMIKEVFGSAQSPIVLRETLQSHG